MERVYILFFVIQLVSVYTPSTILRNSSILLPSIERPTGLAAGVDRYILGLLATLASGELARQTDE